MRRWHRHLGTGLLAMLAIVALHPASRAAPPLPPETVQLRPSSLPGYRIAMQVCSLCHSVDYVAYQPPGMTKQQWTAEMTKMQHGYGAPIDDTQVHALGIYLAATYGDASTVLPEDRAAAAAARPAPADAAALLHANGCLGCHEVPSKLVGPAYRDVAARYRTDPQAVALLAHSIRAGSSGKWGSIAMPPFAALTEAEARTLAAFVLSR